MNADGVYEGVEYRDYVYVAIPFDKDITMDSLAMYLQAKNDVTLYMNVYLIDEDQVPENWKILEDTDTFGDESEGASEEAFEKSAQSETAEETTQSEPDSGEEQEYDDPKPETRIGEITVNLKGGKWASFVLDYFKVNDKNEKSISVEAGQCILLQIRNNSGVRVFDDEKKIYVDEQTGEKLDRAKITMTNLLVRALEIENNTEAEEGEE